MNAAAPTIAVAHGLSSTESVVPLSELRPGESGTILSVMPHFSASRRLLALGFVPGSEISVRRVAPLRDPIEYCVRGTCVSLRRREAAWILVQVASR